MYIPVYHTNRRLITNTVGVVVNRLVGMGLKGRRGPDPGSDSMRKCVCNTWKAPFGLLLLAILAHRNILYRNIGKRIVVSIIKPDNVTCNGCHKDEDVDFTRRSLHFVRLCGRPSSRRRVRYDKTRFSPTLPRKGHHVQQNPRYAIMVASLRRLLTGKMNLMTWLFFFNSKSQNEPYLICALQLTVRYHTTCI